MAIEIYRDEYPPTILPSGIDKSNLIDVTEPNDPARKFFNLRTGAMIRGSDIIKMLWEDDNGSQ